MSEEQKKAFEAMLKEAIKPLSDKVDSLEETIYSTTKNNIDMKNFNDKVQDLLFLLQEKYPHNYAYDLRGAKPNKNFVVGVFDKQKKQKWVECWVGDEIKTRELS